MMKNKQRNRTKKILSKGKKSNHIRSNSKYKLTKKHVLQKNKSSLKLPTKLPTKLAKLINKYHSRNTRTRRGQIKIDKDAGLFLVDMKMLSSDKSNHKPRELVSIIIGNKIDGINNVIKMENLKPNFKKYFTLDYMNYIDYDIRKRKHSFSDTNATFEKKPIKLEAYLMVMISKSAKEYGQNKYIYNSCMLDKIKLITNENVYDFPANLPDNFPNNISASFVKIYEIINQIHTILKYIAIIIGHNTSKPDNIENAVEIIKIRMSLDSDLNVILKECVLKKDWADTSEDNMFYQWLDTLVFKPILGKEMIPDLGLSTASLYKFNYITQINRNGALEYKIPKPDMKHGLYASALNRKDFNDKFIIVSSNFITKIETDLEYKYLAKHLQKYNLTFGDLYSSTGTQPAMIWYGYDEPSRYDIVVQHYNTLAYAGNAIDSTDNINDKQLLFHLMKSTYPNEYLNFMADSFLLNKNTQYKSNSGDIFIARPITEINPETKKKKLKAASGRDIVYITDSRSMQKAKELLERYDNVLISQYIRNPLLFKGRKFHLRVYLLITWFDNIVKTYLFDEAFIWTAKRAFVLVDFDSKEVHDTHYKTTEGDPTFPKDFTSHNIDKPITNEMRDTLWKKIREIMRKVSTLLVKGDARIKMFPNLKNAFQVEGCDIMITEDLRPILIECNSKPGFSNKTEITESIQKSFFAFIDRNVLVPLFSDNKMNTDKPLFVHTLKTGK